MLFTRRKRQADRRRRSILGVETMEGRELLSAAGFSVTQDWGSGFGGQVTISNTEATAVKNWTLAFDFDKSITSVWDGSIVSHTGNHYVITNAGWNADIAANGTASFGFNGASGNVGSDKPTNYVLNGVALGGTTTTPSLSINDVTVREGGAAGTTPMTFTVTLSAASTSTVSVKYATSDGSATAGSDYTAQTGTLSFAPGTTSKSITVPIINDTTASPDETFQVKLSGAVGATIARPAGVGTIIDTVAAANRVPVAVADSSTTTKGSPVTIPVLQNDSDPDGDLLTVTSVTQGLNGSVVKNANGTVTYTPTSSFIGSDSFNYTVADGRGGTATGKVSITVNPAASTAGQWPAHVFAPYVDMTLYPTYDLAATARSQGLRYFTLAFVVADTSNNSPSWGGYSEYDVNGGSFDLGIRSQVAALRQMGGDAMVSFGGASGTELAQAITSVPALTAAYQKVIDAYGLTHIDFDIEGAAVADAASIGRRSQAIASLQATAAAAGKTLDVSFTLPALPTGLTSDGLAVLRSAKNAGVAIGNVNVMAMDFGDYAAPNPSGKMGDYVIQTGESLFTQLKSLYGTSRTDAQLYAMVGVTPMIGVNDVSSEVFTQADANKVLAWATSKGIGKIAMWSLNRDQANPAGARPYAESNSSSIVQSKGEFANIFKTFTS